VTDVGRLEELHGGFCSLGEWTKMYLDRGICEGAVDSRGKGTIRLEDGIGGLAL